jgi:hypothetical protein
LKNEGSPLPTLKSLVPVTTLLAVSGFVVVVVIPSSTLFIALVVKGVFSFVVIKMREDEDEEEGTIKATEFPNNRIVNIHDCKR